MKLPLLILMWLATFSNADFTKEEILDDVAWLYAQFSLTFSPSEITPSTSSQQDSSDSLVPLYSYYKNNAELFDKYKHVLSYFDNLLKIVPGFISADELESRFVERIRFYQNEIIEQDKTPLPFNAFYIIFDNLRNAIGKEKITNIKPVNHPVFCHFRPNKKEVIQSLKKFKLRSYIPNDKANKINKKDFSYLRLSKSFVKELEGDKEPKPAEKDFSIHHMIPSITLEEFYKNYFELLSQQSQDMLQNKKIDWIKVLEIQEQTMFLISADKLWKKYGEEEFDHPVYNYDRNPTSGQENFVRFWYRFPIGLLFYGPKGEIRKDDPSHTHNQEKNNQPNDFEIHVINIIGKEYYDKVFALNTKILEFNSAYKSKSKTKDELKKIAMEINNRLRTIHREAPWANKIIAPFDTNEWNKGEPDPDKPRAQIWEIVKVYDWVEKALAQQSDLDQQFDLARQVSFLSVMLLTNEIGQQYHRDELRKKRFHSTDKRLFYVQKLNMQCDPETTTKEPENGFWCSPFYLRLNPMEYIYCKLSGHHNLHFF
jgi:hypothetical protein